MLTSCACNLNVIVLAGCEIKIAQLGTLQYTSTQEWLLQARDDPLFDMTNRSQWDLQRSCTFIRGMCIGQVSHGTETVII